MTTIQIFWVVVGSIIVSAIIGDTIVRVAQAKYGKQNTEENGTQ
jgi:hypothetical protein